MLALDAHWAMVKAIFSTEKAGGTKQPKGGASVAQFKSFSNLHNSKYQRRGRRPLAPAKEGGANG